MMKPVFCAMIIDNTVQVCSALDELIPYFNKSNCYYCVTRPRRFGKTVMANMAAAFFGKTDQEERIFDRLAIAGREAYEKHLNKHDVIYIDFSRAPRGCRSYEQYIRRIEDGMTEDLAAVYPDCGIKKEDSVWDGLQRIYERTGNKFLFVMDEWDAIFHMTFISEEERKEYLLFLKWLLKDQAYVEFAYMTGVLPISKYSSGSELNMFVEYNMVTSEKFSEYFGFSETEVDRLYEIYQAETEGHKFSREELRVWYDGYYSARGSRLYNPRSVVLALTDNQLRDYTGGSHSSD